MIIQKQTIGVREEKIGTSLATFDYGKSPLFKKSVTFVYYGIDYLLLVRHNYVYKWWLLTTVLGYNTIWFQNDYKPDCTFN